MESSIFFILGIVVAAFFFQLSHISNMKTEKEIERASKETNNIRYAILHWFTKTSRVEGLEEKDGKFQPQTDKIDGKYYTASTINERNISFSITPYITGFYGNVIFFIAVVIIAFGPLFSLMGILELLGLNEVVGSALFFILIVIIMLTFLAVLDFVVGSLNPVNIRIINEKLTISGGGLPPVEARKLQDIEITPKLRFERFTLYSKVPGLRWLEAEGIGMEVNGEQILFTQFPSFLLRWFGGVNLKAIEQKLNQEIKSA